MNYRVPFVNYPKQYHNLKKEIDGSIKRILEKGDLILRSDVKNFENNIASFVGKKYGIGVDSCTGAMFLSLKACGIASQDEVITVAHTYIATIDVIIHCGAKPVLIDIGDDFNMNTDLIEEAITPKTKAIMPVHLNGRVCNMDKLMKVARKHNLLVIEDAAQALGANFKGKMAGSFGVTGCFSFYPAKMLGSFGDAGIIVTDDKKLAERLYLLRDHGEKPNYLKKADEKNKKDIVFFGFNSLLDNIQATILNTKFKYFKGWVKRRREIAGIYQNGLCDLKEIRLPASPGSRGPHFDVFQNYVLRVKERDGLVKWLEKTGVETLVQWRMPNHLQKNLGLRHFHLPLTEIVAKEVVSLPMYPELTDEQVKYAIKNIVKFYRP